MDIELLRQLGQGLLALHVSSRPSRRPGPLWP
jgi:hypothetical protein